MTTADFGSVIRATHILTHLHKHTRIQSKLICCLAVINRFEIHTWLVTTQMSQDCRSVHRPDNRRGLSFDFLSWCLAPV